MSIHNFSAMLHLKHRTLNPMDFPIIINLTVDYNFNVMEH